MQCFDEKIVNSNDITRCNHRGIDSNQNWIMCLLGGGAIEILYRLTSPVRMEVGWKCAARETKPGILSLLPRARARMRFSSFLFCSVSLHHFTFSLYVMRTEYDELGRNTSYMTLLYIGASSKDPANNCEGNISYSRLRILFKWIHIICIEFHAASWFHFQSMNSFVSFIEYERRYFVESISSSGRVSAIFVTGERERERENLR